jgi:hypothetical protein
MNREPLVPVRFTAAQPDSLIRRLLLGWRLKPVVGLVPKPVGVMVASHFLQ